ncbi:putative ATP-grasp superfamily ATP-dependent carboligase [Filimonas zeae]|uniref:DUF3347 domain-containing protein n=1 Tax=Filimonas zeae TaxID=1737353 RepID=A0A917J030_9BACT|nr:DUF3347 domain-containing protein [Filimonas zeae]MDR6340005.1 putative ATP-grasp superfamily ATP-dependent carboligase [Filimonas zeae]GGH70691.1 hypothetical protein GCM10011379_29230 [Filimonas zeae]
MKKGLIVVLVLVAAGVAAWFLLKKEDKPEPPKQQPLAISKNSETFNQAFNTLLENYYSLQNAFVEWDTASTAKAAAVLAASAEKIPFSELKGDTMIVATARSFAESIAAEAGTVISAAGIEEKRRSFYNLSENLYNLARTVKYDKAVVYHVKCPMAFNDTEEAFWIASENKVENPYLGKKHPKYKAGMLNCGEVQDSLDFRQK